MRRGQRNTNIFKADSMPGDAGGNRHRPTPLRAALVVRVGGGAPERVEIVCGFRACGAGVAELYRRRQEPRHEVVLNSMFQYGRWERIQDERPWGLGSWGRDMEVGIRLKKRYERQWRDAKRAGTPWSKFRPQGRRPWRQDFRNYGREFEGRSEDLECVPFRFVCPQCDRLNLADFPEVCGPDCPSHCQTCGRPAGSKPAHRCGPSTAEIEAWLLRPRTL